MPAMKPLAGACGYLRFQYIEPNTIARDEHVHPLRAVQEASAAYGAWRAGAPLWGDQDTGDRVPFMPGGRDAVSRFRASLRRDASS